MRSRSVIRAGATAAVTVGATTLAYATLIERNMFTLRRVDVPALAPDAEPLRLLHISDLHLTPGQRGKQSWVRELVGTDPDLIVVTGDNIAHPDAVTAVAHALGPVLDRPGVFVFGSNDYRGPVFKNPFGYFDRDRPYVQGVELPTEELRELFVAAGWVDLNNARATLKAGGRTVEAVGVDDPHVERDDYDSVAGPASPAVDLRIGLTHTPEPYVLDAMAADGFDLLLAGHTHGGQVRVPGIGALVTNCGLDRHMARGLHRWPAGDRRTWLHVSAGLGTHPTAPIRFACRPEATLLTVIPR
ncbi:MAG TPA: metallophosphoesterase [Micromonosporaceae bacterium]|nr:metallophosphoesterase [Micromonosporaceae bacterium]